ncbi:hypothetical protein ACIQNG_24660 [Streptomyces sp. NPDC091377]|uniref:hypothetical protein n=1 Tax=Streptomyces sp. NPDC091377 TaxID=3365995 RepID=UPI00380B43AA
MSGEKRTRGVRAAALIALVVAVVAVGSGCSDNSGGNSPSSAASKAVSAAQSVGSQAASAAESAASQAASAASSVGAQATSAAASALASASAEATREIDSIKDGVDAKDEVKLGTTGNDGKGHSTVTVTAHNTADATKSFAVQVDFQDASKNLLDVVVVTVSDVAAGKTATADAVSTRTLSGTVRTSVGTAVRY